MYHDIPRFIMERLSTSYLNNKTENRLLLNLQTLPSHKDFVLATRRYCMSVVQKQI